MRDICRGTGHLTTHPELGPAPKNKKKKISVRPQRGSEKQPFPDDSIALPCHHQTVDTMVISSGHLRTLTVERLASARPRIASPHYSQTPTARPTPLLPAVLSHGSSLTSRTEIPDALSLLPLDVGRIHIGDARRLLQWKPGLRIEWQSEGGHLVARESDAGQCIVDRNSRILLPISARRRLGISDRDQVLVLTFTQPDAHLRIVPQSGLVRALFPPIERQ